jgi:protease-4
MNAQEFFNDKLGITTDVEKTNTWSDFGSIYRPLSEAEKLVLQNMVNETYHTFVTRVSDGRGIAYNDVDKIGEGRVWSGTNAEELGLVDVMGGLQKAVEIAVQKAGVKDYRIVELPKVDDAFTAVMKQFTGDIRASFFKQELPDQYNQYRHVKDLLKSDRIQARIPFEINVH